MLGRCHPLRLLSRYAEEHGYPFSLETIRVLDLDLMKDFQRQQYK